MSSHKVFLSLSVILLTLPPAHHAVAQSSELEEVVVTARKRDENIFEIPVSVSALSSEQLDRAGVDNAEELSSFVAGLLYEGSTATGGRVNPEIRFRGMHQQIITPSTQSGATFWDGSYIAAGAGFLPFGDAQRVEVIKGPQTAYFGRNTFTGAVNIIPRLPGDEWETNLDLDFSPSQETEYTLAIGTGGPITDKLGLRVYASHEKDGGDFNTQDGTPYAVFEDTTISGSLVYDATDKLQLKLTGYYVHADDNGTSVGIDSRLFGVPAGQCDLVYSGTLLDVVTGTRTPFTRDFSTIGFATWCGNIPNGDNLVAPVTVNPGPGQSFLGDGRLLALSNLHPMLTQYDILRTPDGVLGGRNQTWRAQFSGDYELGNHTLSWAWSHANTGTVDNRDFFFGVATVPGTVFIVGNNIATRENYYEARISSAQDRRFRYLIGFSDYRMGYRLGNSPVSATQVATGAGATIDFQDNSTFAVFGSIDYDFTDQLTLSVEARFTDEESLQIFQGNPGLPCSDAATTCDALNEYTDFIPRVILSYQPFDGATLYGSYSYSSLLGVATQAAFVSSQVPNVIPPSQVAAIGEFTRPQENTQLEIGWKQQGDNYSITAAVFHANWENQPLASVVVLPTGGTTSFRAAGESEFTGFDVELFYAPVDWFDLRSTIGYVHGEMVSFSSRGTNESSTLGSGALSVVADGNEPRNIPPWMVSISPTFHGNWSGRPWFLRVDGLYRGKTWADYSGYLRAPSQTLVNARWGIELSDRYQLEVYGKNLGENSTVSLNGGTTTGPGLSRKVFTEPYQRREFGIRLSADF